MFSYASAAVSRVACIPKQRGEGHAWWLRSDPSARGGDAAPSIARHFPTVRRPTGSRVTAEVAAQWWCRGSEPIIVRWSRSSGVYQQGVTLAAGGYLITRGHQRTIGGFDLCAASQERRIGSLNRKVSVAGRLTAGAAPLGPPTQPRSRVTPRRGPGQPRVAATDLLLATRLELLDRFLLGRAALQHQAVGDVVLVDVADVGDRFLADLLGRHVLHVLEPDVGVVSALGS